MLGQPLEGAIFRLLNLAVFDLHIVELVFCWGLLVIKATSKHKCDICYPQSCIKLPSRYGECMVTVDLAIGCMAASWWPASHIAAAWQPVRNTPPCAKESFTLFVLKQHDFCITLYYIFRIIFVLQNMPYKHVIQV